MENTGAANFDPLLEHEWAGEVNKLSQMPRAANTIVQILWPAVRLIATKCLPQVDRQTLHILLLPQSRTDSASPYISISLPRSEHGEYLKCANEGGEVFLSVRFDPRTIESLAQTNTGSLLTVQLATSEEFFYLVTGEAQRQ